MRGGGGEGTCMANWRAHERGGGGGGGGRNSKLERT